MSISTVSNELLLLIAQQLQSQKDLKALIESQPPLLSSAKTPVVSIQPSPSERGWYSSGS
jgi:hypothetical protein